MPVMPVQNGLLQRKCACGSHSIAGAGDRCDECKAKRQDLQRKPGGWSEASDVPSIVHDVLRSRGKPLDMPTRSFMETRFEHDFSHVRVHADEGASASARAINARAYTVGGNIVFGAGEYRPHEAAGQKLLAHELAHTMQQAHFASAGPQASLEIGPADDPLEREADRAAEQAMSASPSSPQETGAGHTLGGAPGPMLSLSRRVLQRQEKTKPPLIPIPVFDELDPMIIVPDIPGVPSFLRGQKVKLSTLRSALDVLRGRLPSPAGPGQDRCQALLPGYETAHGGDVDGLCCPQFVRERARCCLPRNIGLMSFRCCTAEEVIVNNRCVRPEPAPLPNVPGPAVPAAPRLESRFPKIPFGTIESETIDHFALNGDAIPPAGAAVLDRLATQLQLYHEVEVHMEGHTDSSYVEEYNQRLSERRAQAVRDALARRGVDARRIVVQGFGETRLLFPGESNPEEKARNRRVEIWFYIPPSRGLGEGLRLGPPTPLTPLTP